MPIYPITEEAWELYGHTMLEENKIFAANPKYVKVIDIPSRKFPNPGSCLYKKCQETYCNGWR